MDKAAKDKNRKRLNAVLAKTRKKRDEALKISGDRQLIEARAKKAAADDWLRILRELEEKAEHYSGGEVHAEILTGFDAPVCYADFVPFVKAYWVEMEKLLSKDFEVVVDALGHPWGEFPKGRLHIKWK